LYKAQLQITSGSTENVQKIEGHRWQFFAKSTGRCFTPVMKIKPNRVSLRWNFDAEIQFTRGRFWMVKKFSEPRVTWKYLAKMWKKCGRNLQRQFMDGQTDGAYLGGRRCVGSVLSLGGDAWSRSVTCLAKSRNGPKMLPYLLTSTDR